MTKWHVYKVVYDSWRHLTIESCLGVFDTGDDETRKKLGDTFHSTAAELKFYEVTQREPGTSTKVTATSMETANKFFAAGAGRVEQVVAKIEETLAG